jgi:transposase
MQQFWAGLDIGEGKTAVCVTSDAGEVLLEQMATSDIPGVAEVLEPFTQIGGVRVSIEAGMGNQLARKLRKLGYPVVVFDTITSNKFLTIRRNKTDANDARGLADLGRMRRTAAVSVHVKSVEIQRLRSQLVFRDQLLRQRTALDSAVRALLRENGGDPKAAPPNKGWRVRLEQELIRLGRDEEVDLTAQVGPMVEVREALDRYVKSADKKVLQTAESNPVTKRFLQIPGVGPISALSFYSAIENPMRFATSIRMRHKGLGPAAGGSRGAREGEGGSCPKTRDRDVELVEIRSRLPALPNPQLNLKPTGLDPVHMSRASLSTRSWGQACKSFMWNFAGWSARMSKSSDQRRRHALKGVSTPGS